MNTSDDLTWRLPLLRRWGYVQPRRCKRPKRFVPWWVVLLLAGPVPVLVALVIVRVLLEMRGGWLLP